MVFRVCEETDMSPKVPITDTGITRLMTSVARMFPRNKSRISTAKPPPKMVCSTTVRMDCPMKTDWSVTMLSSAPAGS
ncbi:hypothetical protein D3C86_2096280 [compost metagenome]